MDPTIYCAILGSPIFGNSHMDFGTQEDPGLWDVRCCLICVHGLLGLGLGVSLRILVLTPRLSLFWGLGFRVHLQNAGSGSIIGLQRSFTINRVFENLLSACQCLAFGCETLNPSWQQSRTTILYP